MFKGLAATLLLSGCGATVGTAGPRAPMPEGVIWSYEVQVGKGVLDIMATFDGPFAGKLTVNEETMPFIAHLALAGGTSSGEIRWRELGADDKAWAQACEHQCLVRYQFLLAEAAAARKDVDTALEAGGALFSPPANWLLRPDKAPESGSFRLHVAPTAGEHFVTGLSPVVGAEETYQASARSLDESSFAGFGPLRVSSDLGNGVQIAVSPELALPDDLLARWATAEVRADVGYLGPLPERRTIVFVVPGTTEQSHGKTLGGGGSSVFYRMGTEVTAANLMEDWVLAHELLHVGSPSLGDADNWFSEGFATYAEPVARVRAKLIQPEKFWGDLVDGLPKGLPKRGDKGLSGADDIDRVYWGGALYFLLADLEIRERSGGKRSLEDAVRAVAAEGAGVETHWTLSQMLIAGDEATGTEVLQQLYHRMGLSADGPDLAALWTSLGVRKEGAQVTFDDSAPRAKLRIAITAENH